MKVSINTRVLEKALAAAREGVARGSYLPILEYVALQCDDGGSKLTAHGCDLKIHVKRSVDAQVWEGGAICVPFRTTNDLVKALPPGRVELETDDKKCALSVTGDRTRATIKGLPFQEFPAWSPPGDGVTEQFDTDWLKGAIKRVAYAASKEESRPILTAVMFSIGYTGDCDIEVVAADGFRLAALKAAHARTSTDPMKALIPAPALAKLAKLLPDDDTVDVTLARMKALFECGDVALASQLVDGNFPSYGAIIPDEWTTRAEVKVADLESAVKRALVFARESAMICRFEFAPAGPEGPGGVTVSARDSDAGDGKTEVDAAVEGDPLDVALNARYVLDALGAAGCDEVAVAGTASSSPVTIRPVGPNHDGDLVTVVMPMHLDPPRVTRDAETGEPA